MSDLGNTNLGAAPKRIGRYEIRSFLGSGGFAAVYQAYDGALDALVAVKVFDASVDEHELARERFLAEAQLLRRVDDPHVVTVFDIGETDDGEPYFVMEYATSGVLSHRTPAEPGRADAVSMRAIVKGLASGLTALHDAGVVHRDIKPANLLITGGLPTGNETVVGAGILRGAERVVIGDLGIAKDTERETADPTILAGTPGFRAPEQMIRGAPITPAADVFGATGVIWSLLTGEHPPEAAALDVQLASAPLEWRAVLRQGFDPDPAQRYATAAEWARDCLEVLGDDDDDSSLGFRSVVGSDTCPYKGLAAFQADDAGLFFGRERLIDELVQRLQASSALVVGGPSGSGKSSLVRAGLIPALQRGVVPGAQHWRVALCTPGTDALQELAFHLRRLADEESDAITGDALANNPESVRRTLSLGAPVLIAIDQFEELFTLNQDETQGKLIDALAALTEGSHSLIRVVLVVRADFYDTCAHFPWLADRINENQVLVGPMRSAELRRAVEGPAQRTGLQIEGGLVDEILDDAGASAGSLPLVAHALMETWLRRRGHQLTVSGYREAGGVAGAISQRAEETYESLGANDKSRARDLVLQMTNPGDGGPDTRRLLSFDEVSDLVAVQPVIDTFVDARLVTTSDQHIELAHETLLRSWPRAIDWINEARDDLRTRQRIADAARDWDERERDADLLLRGTPLESMLDWAEQQSGSLPGTSQEFLDAGRNARDQQDEHEQREQSRRRRNRRLAFAALAVLLTAAVFQSISARRNANEANAASDVAQRQVILGLASTAEAQALSDPLFAMALAGESAARGEQIVPEALGALATARTALAEQSAAPVPLSDAIPVGNVLQLDLTGDGSLLVMGTRDGNVIFFDIATRSVLQSDTTHTKGVESVHINHQLNVLVTGGADGQILLWDLAVQPFVPEVIDTIDGLAVWSAEVSPDGQLLAAITSDAGVTFYDLATREKIATRFDSAVERDALRSVFTQDGTELVVGNSKGEVIRIDVDQAKPVEAIALQRGNVWDLALSADGTYIYSASNDGTVRRIVLDTMTVDPDFVIGMTASVVEMRGVEALANGVDIIAGDADGRIQRWNAVTGELVARSAAQHEDRVIDGAASADGSLYVSLGDDQKIRLWDLSTRTRPIGQTFVTESRSLFGLALAPDGTRAVGTDDGVVIVQRPDNTSVELAVGSGQVFGLAFVDNDMLVVGEGDGALSMWNLASGERVADARDYHSSRVLDIVVSADRKWIVSAASDGLVGLWSAATLSFERTIADIGTEVYGLAITADDELLTVDLGGQVGFWNLDGSRSRQAINAGEDALFAVAIDASGTRFGVAGGNEAIAVFDFATGEKLARLTPLARGAVDLAFTESGAVVGLARSGTIAVWDPIGGAQLGPISRTHALDDEAWRLAIDDRLGLWSTGTDGALFRLDLFDQDIACSITTGVIDEQRRIKFFADESLMACN